MTQAFQTTAETIPGDRRRDRRYTLDLELRYKVSRGRRVLQAGVGRTTDISSRGVAFETQEPLPLRHTAELSVEWPMTLNGCALRLFIQGRVVRSGQHSAAVRILKHEFRLAGAKPAVMERGAAAGRSPGQKGSADSRVIMPRLPF